MRYIGGGVGHISTQDASAVMRRHSQAYADELAREEAEERDCLQRDGMIPADPVPAPSTPRIDEGSDSESNETVLVDEEEDSDEDPDWSPASDSDDEDFDLYGQRWRYADEKSHPRPVSLEDVPDGLEDRDENDVEEQGYRAD